jgi:hypothetical protein
MQAAIHTNEDQLVTELLERMNGAGDGPAARDAYREGFNRLRSQLEISGFGTARFGHLRVGRKDREESRGKLFAIGHRCCHAPLPALRLAAHAPATTESREISAGDAPERTIRNRSLILANAGGERTRGAYRSLVARQDAEDIRIDGTFEYMSLATVADSSSSRRDWQTAIARFCARLTYGPTRCVSELGDSPETCGCRTHLQ